MFEGCIYNLWQGAAIGKPELVPPVPIDDESFLNDSVIVKRALAIAKEAHAGELRRVRGEPFITHPVGVARIASEYDSTDFVQVASLLHDVIDQPGARERISLPEIRREFGAHVLLAVTNLSKTLRPISAQEAKLEYIAIARAETDPQIQLVRAADKIHNLESAIEELRLVQEAFWRHFKGGKAAYLKWPVDVYDAVQDSGVLNGHEILDRYEDTLQRFQEAVDELAS